MTISFDLIGLVTQDLAASLAFYRRLGVDIPEDVDPASPHFEVTLPGGLRLAWDPIETIRMIEPGAEMPKGEQRIGLAFLCSSPSEVDATFAQLVDAGYKAHKEPWDAFWGQRYAQVHDPDDNIVDLFASLESDA